MPAGAWTIGTKPRLVYGYMFGHPGAKLLFMGAEYGQTHEWQHDCSLDWHLLEYPVHKGFQDLIRDLNFLYQSEKALYQNNYSHEGFEWIDFNDTRNSV